MAVCTSGSEAGRGYGCPPLSEGGRSACPEPWLVGGRGLVVRRGTWIMGGGQVTFGSEVALIVPLNRRVPAPLAAFVWQWACQSCRMTLNDSE
jgi:hypothetical protein